MKTINKYIAAAFCVFGLGSAMTSCSNFFDEDSTYIINADQEHLNNATDTIYSVIGILNKVQAIADRTILLGEARGDLVNVTSATSADLRQVANFTVDDDNMYNQPSDYYAIINNCNYFIAHVDTALQNNRGQNIFMKEYAAVKAIRAWTYLQLVTTYGKVPFVIEPIMSKEEAEKDYPMYDIQQVCDYFIFRDGLQNLVDEEYPSYGTIKSLPSSMFFIPMRLVLGDLCLWAGEDDMAAIYYHDYLNNKNGQNTIYPTSLNAVTWRGTNWMNINDAWEPNFAWSSVESTPAKYNELISYIPMDSIPSEGYFSQLRNIFNSTSSNDYKVSLVPSEALQTLSADQTYCYNDDGDCIDVPKTVDDVFPHANGDLRLYGSWLSQENYVPSGSSESVTYQYIRKYQTKNVRIYRRTLVYLRLAEALNRLGYPRYAFQILSSGVNEQILQDSIIPHYRADSAYIMNNFKFKGDNMSSTTSAYVVVTDPSDPKIKNSTYNMLGIHSRGSGFTPGNKHYQMPYNPEITDSVQQIKWQQDSIEKMIVNEEALEFAFEGYRFYDLMRFAMRRNDPSFLANKIKLRNGNVSSGVSVDLTDQKNWFLKWNGKIGY